jgi:hypothetical protein
MSGSDPETAFWTAPPIYEYLMARLAMQGGSASEPLILAATAAQHVDEEGAPSETSANTHRFEPGQPVYVSVAGIALSPGSTIETRLYRRSALIKSESRAAAAANRWYAFQVLDKKIVPSDDYHVDVYLDGVLAKTVEFEIKSGK